MKTPPISIAIVAAYLIISKVIILADMLIKFNDPAIKSMYLMIMASNDIPVKIQLGIYLGYSAVIIICAIAIWYGKNWGRLLYFAAMVIILAYTAASTNPLYKMVPQVFWTLVILYILFCARANVYFKHKSYVANLF
jgi:hypothetical protein